ncbi:MAG: dockerin type I repeat-containing protein [bacterium]
MSRSQIILLCGLLLALPLAAAQSSMVSGDANNDGIANITDAVYIVQYIFNGGPTPLNQSYADITGDCIVNIADATTMIGFIFTGNPPYLGRGCVSQDFNPGCASDPVDKMGAKTAEATDYGLGYLYAEVLGNDLYLHHIDAEYQCCLGYLVEYEIDGFEITATESDTGDLCDCICDFDLTSVLYDLEDGEYIVTLIGIYGDEIGVDTVVVAGEFGLTGYGNSGCLEMTATFDPPDVDYLYGNGELSLVHHDAYYNCASAFLVQFEQAGDTMRFYELNIEENCAYCMCYFEITATVVGIAPGNYTAEIWGQDCLSPLELKDRREITLE